MSETNLSFVISARDQASPAFKSAAKSAQVFEREIKRVEREVRVFTDAHDPLSRAQRTFEENLKKVDNALKRNVISGTTHKQIVDSITQAHHESVSAIQGHNSTFKSASESAQVFERGLDNLEREVRSVTDAHDPLARAQRTFEENTNTINRALQQGIITSNQAERSLQGLKASYDNAEQALRRQSSGFKSAQQSAQVFESELENLERNIRRITEAHDPLSRAQRQLTQNIETVSRAQRQGILTSGEAANAIQKLEASHKRAAIALKRQSSAFSVSGRGMGAFGTVVQQTGFQVADFAVQVGSGQRAMVAFTQQAPQLLQIFGPLGSAIGAGVAVFGAITLAMNASRRAAEENTTATDAYAKSLRDVNEELILAAEGERGLTIERQRQDVEGFNKLLREQKEELEGLIKTRDKVEGRAGTLAAINPLNALNPLNGVDTVQEASQNKAVEISSRIFELQTNIDKTQKAINVARQEEKDLINGTGRAVRNKSEAATKAANDQIVALREQAEAIKKGDRELQIVVETQKIISDGFKGSKADARALATEIVDLQKGLDGSKKQAGGLGDVLKKALTSEKVEKNIEALQRQATAIQKSSFELNVVKETQKLISRGFTGSANEAEAFARRIVQITEEIKNKANAEREADREAQRRSAEQARLASQLPELQVELIRDPFEQRAEELRQQKQEEIDIAKAALDQQLIDIIEHDNLVKQIKTKSAEDLKMLELERNADIVRGTGAFFDSLASIAENFGGEQSTAYRALFAVKQAAAIAEAIVNTQVAITQASTQPFPLNIAGKVTAAATGAAAVANIAAQGFRSGGFTGNGAVNSVAGVVHGQEHVIRAGPAARFRGFFDEVNRTGNLPSSQGGGGGVSVTVVNNGTPQNYVAESISMSDIRLIATDVVNERAPSIAVEAVSRDTQRPNSQVRRAMGTRSNIREVRP